MYLGHFKFKSKPFALNPDPAFMYPSEQHAKALTMLEYAIESQSPFCMLTGEIGSGKTTILRHFIRNLDARITVGLISHTHQRFRSIYPWALSALGVVPRAARKSGASPLISCPHSPRSKIPSIPALRAPVRPLRAPSARA